MSISYYEAVQRLEDAIEDGTLSQQFVEELLEKVSVHTLGNKTLLYSGELNKYEIIKFSGW